MTSVSAMVGTAEGELNARVDRTGIFYSVSDVISDPIGFVTVFVRTIFELTDHYMRSSIGGSLGWFQGNIVAQWFMVIYYIFIIYIAALKNSDSTTTISTPQRIGFISISIAVCILSMVSMYLSSTFNDEPVIMGFKDGIFCLSFP